MDEQIIPREQCNAMNDRLAKDPLGAIRRLSPEEAGAPTLQRLGTGVKPQLSYILDFDHALDRITEVMQRGAKKYSRNNWKGGGPNASLDILLDSVVRHLKARQNGEVYDAECGTDHLANACCGLLFALYHHGKAPEKKT